MTARPSQNIIAYGAAAEPALQPRAWLTTARSRVKYAYHALRDRQRWKSSDLSLLDYRNYQDPTTLNRGDQAIVDAVLLKLRKRDADLAFTRVNWGRLGSIPASAAMVAICGGGYLFVDKHSQLAQRVQVDAEMLHKASVPVVLFGVGVNQLIQPGRSNATDLPAPASTTIACLLERVDLISVRDWNTHKALTAHTDKRVHMVGDPALYLAAPTSARKSTKGALQVGINLPFHGPTSNAHLRRNLTPYVTLFKRIERTYTCQFTFMVHYATETVVARLLQDAGIAVSVVSGSPTKLVAAYGELDIHMGGMLHSCILSTSAGTPCIGLAYDVKHAGFFEVMELPQQCISAVDFDVDLAFETFSKVCASLPSLREKILQRRLELESEFDRFVDLSLAQLSTTTGQRT